MTPTRAYFKVKHRRPARTAKPPTLPASPSLPPASAPTRRAFVFLVASLVLLAAVLWLYSYLTVAAGQLMLAMIIASLFEPAVSFFEKRGWSRFTGVTVVLTLSALTVFAAFQPFAQRLAQEAAAISSLLSSPRTELFGRRLMAGAGEAFPWMQNPVFKQELLADYEAWRQALAHGTRRLTALLLTSGPALILLALIVFVLLAEGRRLRRALLDAVPNRHLEKSVRLLHALPARLQQFWRIQALAACAVAALMALALYLMHIPSFLVLGMFAGLGSLTPYFGSLLGAAIALMIGVAASGAYSLTLPLLMAFATIDLLKNAALSSRVFKAGSILGPLETILGMLVAGSLAGLWGLFFAAPVLATIKIVLQESLKMARDFRTHS